MRIAHLKPHFASEISASALADTEALEALLVERKVLVVRNCQIDSEEFVELMRALGEPHENPPSAFVRFGKAPVDTGLAITIVANDGFLGADEMRWHGDGTYLPDNRIPICGLRAVKIPAEPVPTIWCDANWAFERFPKDLVSTLEGMLAEFAITYRDFQSETVSHPLVSTHPVTKRKRLMLDDGFVRSIAGMSMDDFYRLRAEVLRVTTDPENLYRHEWRAGDLVLYENSTTLHYRPSFSPKLERELWRVMVRPHYYRRKEAQ